jgi:hypothetical protein
MLRDARRALRLVLRRVQSSLLSVEVAALPPVRTPRRSEPSPGEMELFVVREPERYLISGTESVLREAFFLFFGSIRSLYLCLSLGFSSFFEGPASARFAH